MKIILVVAARPNFMKIAPIEAELRKRPDLFDVVLVHTGQHYDEKMSRVFFEELGLPEPDVYLGAGSGSHAAQTAQVMVEFEKVLLKESPDWVVVAGDVNSTLACALDAAKLHIPVAHVEAGLRSRDRAMPEEVNRVMTDAICDLLFTPSRDGDANLLREGVDPARIAFVGNVMIDSLRKFEAVADASRVLETLGVGGGRYGLVTLHRPSNVDDPVQLGSVLDALEEIQRRIPLIFPVHPRSLKMMKEHGLQSRVESLSNLRLIEPVGYVDFLKLEKNAALVLTDSGGIQEETTAFGVPCLTLRENTERPVTVEEGTNVLVGLDKRRIVAEAVRVLSGDVKTGRLPELWDGRAAERIVASFMSLRPAGVR